MINNHVQESIFRLLVLQTGMQKVIGSGGIRTHAPEETGALNQRQTVVFFFFAKQFLLKTALDRSATLPVEISEHHGRH